MARRWIKQTKFGKKGNCMAAALAGLFKVSLKQTQPISDKVEGGWYQELHAFCTKRGYTWLIISKHFKDCLPNTLYLAIGQSPRNKDRRHCVVMQGNQMLFDPHPSNKGIKTIDELWVFIPTDPA